MLNAGFPLIYHKCGLEYHFLKITRDNCTVNISGCDCAMSFTVYENNVVGIGLEVNLL